MQSILSGANILLYVNNRVVNYVQNISLSIDYGESPIFGIDALYPQEIAPTRITVSGTVSGVRTKNSGGVQAMEGRPLFTDASASPYISIRITDRSTNEDIIFIAEAKITNEKHGIAVKGAYKLSWDFVGQIPLMSLDRAPAPGISGLLGSFGL